MQLQAVLSARSSGSQLPHLRSASDKHFDPEEEVVGPRLHHLPSASASRSGFASIDVAPPVVVQARWFGDHPMCLPPPPACQREGEVAPFIWRKLPLPPPAPSATGSGTACLRTWRDTRASRGMVSYCNPGPSWCATNINRLVRVTLPISIYPSGTDPIMLPDCVRLVWQWTA